MLAKENESIESVVLWPFEAGTQGVLVALWWSGTRGLAVDPLCPVGCKVEPTGPWIWLVPACPRDAQSDWDLGNSKARSTPWSFCHVPQLIPELFFQCGGAHCPAGGGALPTGSFHGEVYYRSVTYMIALTQSFPRQHCIVMAWSMSFTSPVSPFNGPTGGLII